MNEGKGNENNVKFISNTFGHRGNLFDNNERKYKVDDRQRDKKYFSNTKKIITKINVG